MQSIGIATLKEKHWVYCIPTPKFHHYCFAREVSVTMDHKPLVAIFKKRCSDPAHPPQNTSIQGQTTVQAGARNIHCRLAIPTKSQGKKSEAICGMNIRVDPIQTSTNVPEYMSIQQIQQVTAQDGHLQQLKGYIITGWPGNKDHLLCKAVLAYSPYIT